MMIKKLSIILPIILFCAFVFSQSKISDGDGVREANRDQIYLKYEGKKDGKIRLRLYNNSKWAISVDTFTMYILPKFKNRIKLQNGASVFLLPNDKDIGDIHYATERRKFTGYRKTSLEMEYFGTHVVTRSWIGSKDSIFFTLPKKQLPKGTKLYISFRYEWELDDQNHFPSDLVEHRVYFRR